jgi:hypothetical protein
LTQSFEGESCPTQIGVTKVASFFIPHAQSAFATLHVGIQPVDSIKSVLEGAETKQLYQVEEIGSSFTSGDIYNLLFLFHKEGEPWHEANSYLLSLIENKTLSNRPTDDLRRRASKLLDYLIYCESEGLNWLDFSGVALC